MPSEPADLARGIAWTIDEATCDDRLGVAARAAAVERFGVEGQAAQYVDLYREVLG